MLETGFWCLCVKMAEITQHMDMTYKQACIDLEKATQLITQVLQVRICVFKITGYTVWSSAHTVG